MTLFFSLAWGLVFLFIITLFARVVIDLVRTLARDWRPSGVSLIFAEVVFSATDPPLRALRKVIPPLTLGRIRLDLAFMILLILCYILMSVFAALAGPR